MRILGNRWEYVKSLKQNAAQLHASRGIASLFEGSQQCTVCSSRGVCMSISPSHEHAIASKHVDLFDILNKNKLSVPDLISAASLVPCGGCAPDLSGALVDFGHLIDLCERQF